MSKELTVKVEINSTELTDEGAEYVRTHDRPAIINALEVGISVLNRVQTRSDVDFVKGQIEVLMTKISSLVDALPKRVQEDIMAAVSTNFDPGVGTSYSRRFAEALRGDAVTFKATIDSGVATIRDELARIERNTDDSETGTLGKLRTLVGTLDQFIKASLDGTNTSGFAWKIDDLLHRIELTLGMAVANSVRENVRKEVATTQTVITDELVKIREMIAERRGAAEVMEKSSGKGFTFEDELQSKLEAIAAQFGEQVERTGLTTELSGSKKGDFLYTTSTGRMIVIEAKDKPVALKESTDYMKAALEDRGSPFGILLSRYPDQLQKQIGRWNVYENIIIGCVDDIEISLKYARWRVILDTVQAEGVNVGTIQAKLRALEMEIRKFAEVKKTLTNMTKASSDGAQKIADIIDQVRSTIEGIVDEIEREIAKGRKAA